MSTQTYASARKTPGSSCTKICIWPSLQLSTASLHCKLRLGLTPALLKSIFEVVRVCQRDGRIRFDLVVSSSYAVAILKSLNSARHTFGYCKFHTSYRARRARTALASQSAAVSSQGSSIFPTIPVCASLNVNSLTKKRDEVEQMLLAENVVVAALQETLTPSWTFGPRISGFRCYGSRSNPKVAGARGICLAVRKGLTSSEIMCSNFVCVVKVLIKNVQIVFASVYIPCAAAATNQSRATAFSELSATISKFSAEPLVILGDLNMNVAETKKMIEVRNWNVNRVPINGFTFSSFHQTCIDHVLVSPLASSLISSGKVDHSIQISDHFPIFAPINVSPTPSSQLSSCPEWTPLRLDFSRMAANRDEFVNHEIFSSIFQQWSDCLSRESPTLSSVTNLYNSFVSATKEVCADLSMIKPVSTATFDLPQKAIQMLQEKRELCRLSQSLLAIPTDDFAQSFATALRVHLNQFSRICVSFLRAIRRRRWSTFITKVVSQCGSNKKRLYSLIKNLTGCGRAALGLSPVMDSTGALQSNPATIMSVWESHFTKVFSARTISNPATFTQSEDVPSNLKNLGDSVSWNEFQLALRTLRIGKAPGPSGIPAELLKICLEKKGTVAGPSNAFGQIIFALVSSVINNGLVPAEMATSFIIPIPKKSSGSTSTGDFRPISLMDSVQKIASHIMKIRLAKVLPSVVSREQAGFRVGEESNVHVAALREIVSRQLVETKQPVFVAFVDLQLAFDSVPHQLLLDRLMSLGFPQQFVQFVAGSYSNCSGIVRVGNFCSNNIPIACGVRQGCPLSPLLFNIFVDILCAKARPFGVKLNDYKRIGALLFADDIVLISNSDNSLRNQIANIDIWCSQTGMRLNVAKCAVMKLDCNGCPTACAPINTLQGQIPTTNSYKYLGVPFTGVSDSSFDAIFRARLTKTQNSFFGLVNALRIKDIPINMRVCLIKSFLVPVASFGLEFLHVQCKTQVDEIDNYISQALNVAVNGSKRGKCSALVLRREFNLPTLFSRVMGSRARMFLKFANSITAIRLLYSSVSQCGSSWMQSTKRWLQRINCPQVSQAPIAVAAQIRDRFWRSEEERDKSISMSWYRANAFQPVSLSFASFPRSRFALSGVDAVMQLRSNSFQTVPRLAHFLPSLSASHSSCPFCQGPVPESFEHLLLHCSAWSQDRVTLISPVLQAFRRFGLEPADDAARVKALLGGGAFSKFWFRKVDSVALAVRVAQFMAAVVPARRVVLFPRK